jgi:hypothetical protein
MTEPDDDEAFYRAVLVLRRAGYRVFRDGAETRINGILTDRVGVLALARAAPPRVQLDLFTNPRIA